MALSGYTVDKDALWQKMCSALCKQVTQKPQIGNGGGGGRGSAKTYPVSQTKTGSQSHI